MTLRRASHLRTRPHWLRRCVASLGLVILICPIMVATATTTSTSLASGSSLTVACSGTRLSASRISATSYSLACSGAAPTTTTTPPTTTTVPPVTTTTTPGVASSGPLYGMTLDDISGINSVISTDQSIEQSVSVKVASQVVFDWNSTTNYQPASYYASAMKSLQAEGPTFGLLLDSGYQKGVAPATYSTMVNSYLKTLGSSVNVWEIGNEVNGNWTGPYSTVAADISAAYSDVSAVGGVSALTLYANEYGSNNCGDGASELTPVQFSNQYVPASVRDGLSYVFESYYPTQCSPVTYPTSAQVATEMIQLHALYPNALVGFGEMGTPNGTEPLATQEKVMGWSYSLAPGLSYYVGGYFWWYGAETLVPATKPLYPYFVSALTAEQAALNP